MSYIVTAPVFTDYTIGRILHSIIYGGVNLNKKYVSFTVSFLLAIIWLGLSTAISITWIQDVARFLPGWYVG